MTSKVEMLAAHLRWQHGNFPPSRFPNGRPATADEAWRQTDPPWQAGFLADAEYIINTFTEASRG